MRPERDNIAAPDLPDQLSWIGEAPRSMPVLTASGPVLVHFIDFAQLNSARTLPYLSEWDHRYREAGLTTIGVQAPRFPFGSDPAAVGPGLAGLDIEFPVAIDGERDLWHAYGCKGWPSLFLWSNGGALSWFHFGEGEYLATETAIQEELRELDVLRSLPEPMAPLRPSDAPGVKVMPPTSEVFPGGSWEQAWSATEGAPTLRLDYAAGGAYVTAEGKGELRVALDDEPAGTIAIDRPGLHPLAEHERHESHRLEIKPDRELLIWSVSFAAGLP